MGNSSKDEDYAAIAEKLVEKLAAKNPGLFVPRAVCDERYAAVMAHVDAIKGVVDHLRTLSVVEIIGVLISMGGIIMTAILVATTR